MTTVTYTKKLRMEKLIGGLLISKCSEMNITPIPALPLSHPIITRTVTK